MNSLDCIKNIWCFSIVTELGDGETPEDIVIDVSHPYIFEKPISGCSNIDDLISFVYIKNDFYSFECTTGIIVYYRQVFKKLFENHQLCYYSYNFFFTDLYVLYTGEYIATVTSDNIAYASLVTTVYGSDPVNNDIIGHKSIPFDFYFLDCIESFKLLQFDRLKRDKKPVNCTRVSYPDSRLLDPSNSFYMLYVNQSLSTITYYSICAIIHGLRTGQFDIINFNGKLFIDTGDRGVVIKFNSILIKYMKLFTKLIFKTKDKNCDAESIVRTFYNSDDKVLYRRY